MRKHSNSIQIYVGQTSSSSLIPRLTAMGFGECTQRGELVRPVLNEVGPKRYPWFFDNLAWSDFNQGKEFDAEQYEKDLVQLPKVAQKPDFIVVPDLVARGVESLAFSLSWVERLRGLAPLYLVTQNGQTVDDVECVLDLFDGLFVGGTVPWKIETGAVWVDLAHKHGKKCHIGRAGSIDRSKWAIRIGADSLDSSAPLFSEESLQRFAKAVQPCPQLGLFGNKILADSCSPSWKPLSIKRKPRNNNQSYLFGSKDK